MTDTIAPTLDVTVPPVAALTSELALRIHGGDYHGRVVRIRASQCTVGAAPDCTLRLSAPGLRPLHCIILRGEAGPTVRRWSPDTQLNGRAFSDALLMPGDRLSVGPIELEVLDDADLSANRRPEPAASTIPVAELAQEVASQLRRDLRRTETARKSKIEKRNLRKSQRRIKSLEAEIERLQASVNSIAAVDQPTAPPQPEDNGRLEAERGAWDSERQSLLSRLQEKEGLAERLEHTLDDLQQALEQERLAANADRQQGEQEADACRQQLQAQYDELVGRSQALQEAEAAASAHAKELQERIAALEQRASHASQETAQTSEAIHSTQQQLQETIAECERLREEVRQANCALAAAEQCAAQASQETAQTSEAFQSSQRQVQETLAECERLREEVRQANCALAAAEQCAAQASQETAQTSEAFQSSQRQVQETLAECERLREEVRQANCALSAAEQCAAQASQETAQTSEAFQSSQRQVQATLAECERLREELRQANDALAAAERSAAQASQETAQASEAIQSAQAQLQATLAECERLREELRQANDALAAAEQSAAQASQETAQASKAIQSMQRQLQEALAECDRLREQLCQANSALAAAEQSSTQVSQQAAQTSETLQSTQRQLHETFAECERLREELHQANGALAAAQCRLTEQEAALTSFREMHHHAIAELELEAKTLLSQLTDAQAKFDEQAGRLADLESQSHLLPTPEQIAELERQSQASAEELQSVRAERDELRSAAEQSSIEWSQREQELMQRNECLERLAANLEDELRRATSNPEHVQAIEQQRQSLEQQLASAQRQWSEQRQELEEQSLSAHQQMQEMENQVASMRDALHTAQGQVRERDQLLGQVRDEVRQQMVVWQQECDQLREQLAAAQQGGPSEDCRMSPQHPAVPTILPEEIHHEPVEDRYVDRQMLAGGHALSEVEEVRPQRDSEPSQAAENPEPTSVAEALSRLESAGVWRSQEACVESSPGSLDAPGSENELPPAETGEALVNPPDEPCQVNSDTSITAIAHAVPDESSPEPASQRVNVAATLASVAQSSDEGAKSNDEDESIETYMARLLKRVRGDAVANAFAEQQAATMDGASAAATPGESAPASTELISVAPITAEEFVPRKLAPEQPTDVKAMRELAIESARQAISHSSRLRFQQSSLATTLGACAFAALSVGLFAWAFDTGNWLAWGGCAASLFGTVYTASLRLKTRRILKAAA